MKSENEWIIRNAGETNQAEFTFSMEMMYFPLFFPSKVKIALSYFSLCSSKNLISTVACSPEW